MAAYARLDEAEGDVFIPEDSVSGSLDVPLEELVDRSRRLAACLEAQLPAR